MVSTGDVVGSNASCSTVVLSTMLVFIAESPTSGTTDCSLTIGYA